MVFMYSVIFVYKLSLDASRALIKKRGGQLDFGVELTLFPFTMAQLHAHGIENLAL